MASGLKSIEQNILKGKVVQAIKLYRELYSSSLKEAKNAVVHFQKFQSWPDHVQKNSPSAKGSTSKVNGPVLPLRGDVVDLVQHHDWLLVAATHSEGQCLGIQAVPLHGLNFEACDPVQIASPKPIRTLLALPNIVVPTPESAVIRIEGEDYDARMIQLVRRNASALVDNQEGTIHALYLALIDQEGAGGSDITALEEKTLSYIKANFLQDNATVFAKLDLAVREHETATRFGKGVGPGQRVYCVDDDGKLYKVPTLVPVDQPNQSGLSVSPLPLNQVVERAHVYDESHLFLILQHNKEQMVGIYNIEQEQLVFEMAIPQFQDDSLDDGQPLGRSVTAATTDLDSGRFALGFDDGLYLFFERDNEGDDALSFKAKPLYNTQREILKELHEQPVTQLIFSNEHDGRPFLVAAAADLTMSVINLSESIPREKGTKNGHKKNIRQFIKGLGRFFYSIGKDDTLRMWRTEHDKSSAIDLVEGPITLVCVPIEDNRGDWSYIDLLVAGQPSSHLDSTELVFHSITNQLLNEPEKVLSIAEEDTQGKVKESPMRMVHGMRDYAMTKMRSDDVHSRQSLLELVGTLKDNLSVQILEEFVQREENPQFVSRALELLKETNHPKLPVILTKLMEVPREATCLRVMDFLRMKGIYGADSLFPMDLADGSKFLAVRQKALRGYAELASLREASPENTLYQSAYERVLERLRDKEDDIVDVAFQFLFTVANPLLPGVKGVLTAIATPDATVQKRGLELLYTKGMLRDPELRPAAQDLLRQVRDSNEESLRKRAFLLSLTMEAGVQAFLRYIDRNTHTKLRELERAEEEAEQSELESGFELDQDIIDLFLAAVPEPNKEDKEVDAEEAKQIVAAAQLSTLKSQVRVQTFLYCTQTFPMSVAVQEYLQEAVVRSREDAPPLGRDLTAAEERLLQEMAVSYQADVSSLGALALAKLGRVSALPILLLLADDKDELVRSRAVDGLLEFIHEPIVEQKIRHIVLHASNEAIKANTKDKGQAIRLLVEKHSLRITRSIVDTIVSLIFEDNVYSHTERMAVRYLFESVEVQFSSNTRLMLFESIKKRSHRPKEINIRAKAMRALFKQASERGGNALLHLLRQTQDSAFEDIRVLGVMRLQERIDERFEAAPDWKDHWHMLTAEDWSSDEEGLGGLLTTNDGTLVSKSETIDPLMPIIGLPRPVLEEVQILNRALFWRGHESVQEVIKTYLKHQLIGGNFLATRRFLLSLSIEPIYNHLLKEILDNIQDTMIKGDPNIPNWHKHLWHDFLTHDNFAWAEQFCIEACNVFEQPKTPEELEAKAKGESIPPYAPFLRALFNSHHPVLKTSALSTMLEHFNDDWVSSLLFTAFESDHEPLRAISTSTRAIRYFKHNAQQRSAIVHLLNSAHLDMLSRGVDILTNLFVEDIDSEIIDILLSRMSEVSSSESLIDSNFLYKNFLKQEIFENIPSGEQELAYYSLLSGVFVYEVDADIVPQVQAYETILAELESKRDEQQAEIDRLRHSSQDEDKVALEAAQVTHRLVLRDINQLEVPKPRQDNRFFKALGLLAYGKGEWIQVKLDEMMTSMDAKLSDEAFDIYFSRGISGADSESFLLSMLQDHHPRLDDVFEMVTSGQHANAYKIKTIMLQCRELSRIDLVFGAFEYLFTNNSKKNPLLSEADWQQLQSSPHPFLRYSAHKYFLGNSETKEESLKQLAMTFCSEPQPVNHIDLLTDEEIEVILSSEAPNAEGLSPSEPVHVFLKNGKSLNFTQVHAIQTHIPIGPSFVRRLCSSDLHCLVSGLSLKDAFGLKAALAKENISLLISKSNPTYHSKSMALWRSIMFNVLKFICEVNWESNASLFAELYALDTELAKSNPTDSLRPSVVQAMGSVATADDCQALAGYLADEALAKTAAVALSRTGHIEGLRWIFNSDADKNTVIS